MPVDASSVRKRSKSSRARPGSSALSKLGRRPFAIDPAQRELRDREDRSARFGDVAVHLPCLVGENPQLADLLRRAGDLLFRIALLYRRENDDPGGDLGDALPADVDRCAPDALNDALHGRGFYAR